MTKGDCIRVMSDEELARWALQFVIDCTELTLGEECRFEDGAEEIMTKWLKQPVDEEAVCTADLAEKEYSGLLEE